MCIYISVLTELGTPRGPAIGTPRWDLRYKKIMRTNLSKNANNTRK